MLTCPGGNSNWASSSQVSNRLPHQPKYPQHPDRLELEVILKTLLFISYQSTRQTLQNLVECSLIPDTDPYFNCRKVPATAVGAGCIWLLYESCVFSMPDWSSVNWKSEGCVYKKRFFWQLCFFDVRSEPVYLRGMLHLCISWPCAEWGMISKVCVSSAS